jgi:hypothetical protein
MRARHGRFEKLKLRYRAAIEVNFGKVLREGFPSRELLLRDMAIVGTIV